MLIVMSEKDNIVAQRKIQFAESMVYVAQAGVQHGKGNDYNHTACTARDAINEKVDEDSLPWFVVRQSGSYATEEGEVRDYWFNIFSDLGEEIVGEGWDEEKVREKLEEINNRTMPSLPSDGSKGQWRSCQKAKRRTCEWFLGELNSYENRN